MSELLYALLLLVIHSAALVRSSFFLFEDRGVHFSERNLNRQLVETLVTATHGFLINGILVVDRKVSSAVENVADVESNVGGVVEEGLFDGEIHEGIGFAKSLCIGASALVVAVDLDGEVCREVVG